MVCLYHTVHRPTKFMPTYFSLVTEHFHLQTCNFIENMNLYSKEKAVPKILMLSICWTKFCKCKLNMMRKLNYVSLELCFFRI